MTLIAQRRAARLAPAKLTKRRSSGNGSRATPEATAPASRGQAASCARAHCRQDAVSNCRNGMSATTCTGTTRGLGRPLPTKRPLSAKCTQNTHPWVCRKHHCLDRWHRQRHSYGAQWCPHLLDLVNPVSQPLELLHVLQRDVCPCTWRPDASHYLTQIRVLRSQQAAHRVAMSIWVGCCLPQAASESSTSNLGWSTPMECPMSTTGGRPAPSTYSCGRRCKISA